MTPKFYRVGKVSYKEHRSEGNFHPKIEKTWHAGLSRQSKVISQ